MAVVTKNNIFSINLFGVLNTCLVFCKMSFICMQTSWIYSIKILTTIGKTRQGYKITEKNQVNDRYAVDIL